MIRDPSDGSVKPPPANPGLTNSGLAKPEHEKSDEKERLDRSREWLKEWRERMGK
jgi:hypothetical protein